MKVSIVGTGYVGLVTGVCLADIGHEVTCIDINPEKVAKLKKSVSPIFEPGIEEFIKRNLISGNLNFTTDYKNGFENAEVIFIAVGTPELPDGSADLQYIESVSKAIASYVSNDVIVVIKSTVPVGTNQYVKELILNNLSNENLNIEFASNPEFLREGSAIYDTFNGDRIVIGTENEKTASILKKLYEPFNLPVFNTDIKSAEMIKYASNAFLATKISFINEISNICEKVEADIEDVSKGMGLDSRIGTSFLNAGIGYGGSCFPKDTQALIQIAGGVKHDFNLLKSVIEVNNRQQKILVEKVAQRFDGKLEGKKIAMLGLAFKPNTDDMREAASAVIAQELINRGVLIQAYDPIAIENAKVVLPQQVKYTSTLEAALNNVDAALIITEWDVFKDIDLTKFEKLMKNPIVFDGRNCFSLAHIDKYNIEYHSIGRRIVNFNTTAKNEVFSNNV